MALRQEVECNNVHTKKASVIMKTMMLRPQVNEINYAKKKMFGLWVKWTQEKN